MNLIDTPAAGELRIRLFYQARREWERGVEGLSATDQLRLLIGADAALAETGADACLPEHGRAAVHHRPGSGAANPDLNGLLLGRRHD